MDDFIGLLPRDATSAFIQESINGRCLTATMIETTTSSNEHIVKRRRRPKVNIGKPKVPLTLSIAFVATPTVVKTFLNHYLTPKSKKTKNPAMRQLSYEEAVYALRKFLRISPSPSKLIK